MKSALAGFYLVAALASGASAETPNRWGAIALNLQTRGVGLGWDFSEEWEARNEALKGCGWGDCKVHLIANNACGVLVVDFAKSVIGVSTYPISVPDALEKATARAIYECKSRGGDCRISVNTAWVCSGGARGRGDVVGFQAPPKAKTKVVDDHCIPGFVWRLVTPADHVCVAPRVRTQVRVDNKLAPQRRIGGEPDKLCKLGTRCPKLEDRPCKAGFVWREAVPDDHVCVTPETRKQAEMDNKAAPQRRVDYRQ